MKRKSYFTLVELLVVMVILLLLAAVGLPALHGARQRARETVCLGNLREISTGIGLFYNDHQKYPQDDYLRTELEPYLGTSDVEIFRCPATKLSYEAFYVPRGMGEELDFKERKNYFLGCNYHKLVQNAVGQGTHRVVVGKITRNGVNVSPGTVVESGTLHFADGSTAEISNGEAMILTSFRMADQSLYTILRVFEDYGDTTIEVHVPDNVSPKSKFEVITPAAIIGVAGTIF